MAKNLVVTARINSFVKQYMKKTGIKQGHLAERMGYNPKKFSQLINGRVPMQIEDLANICKFFQVSADKFIPLEDDVKIA